MVGRPAALSLLAVSTWALSTCGGSSLLSSSSAFIAPLHSSRQPRDVEGMYHRPRAWSSLRSWSMSAAPVAAEVESTGSSGGGLEVFARKARQRDIQAFRSSLPRDDPLFEELDKVGTYPPQEILYKALRLNNFTVTVIAEYFRKAPFEYLGTVLEPSAYGKIFRDARAAAISVNLDPNSGGSKYDDLLDIVEEQTRMSGRMPGPVPVIMNDLVVDPIQVALAKRAGARGVVIRYGLNPPEVTKELIQTTLGLGMEPIVQIRSVEEGNAAYAQGAKVLMVFGMGKDAAKQIKPGLPSEAALGFDLHRPAEYSYNLMEVKDAWILRDEGFNTVLASDVLWKSPLDDVTGPTSVIRAIRAKACSFLREPLDWISRQAMDGAKETLGELMA